MSSKTRPLVNHLKIALISHEFPPYLFGGVGSHCYDLAYNLTKAGIDVTVFAGKSKHIKIEEFDSIKVVRLPLFDFPPRPLMFQLRNFNLFSKIINDYDAVHVVDVQSGAVPIYFAKKLRKPIISSFHSVPSIYILKRLFYSSINDLSLGDIGLDFLEYPIRESANIYCLKNSTHAVCCGYFAMNNLKEYLGLDSRKTSVIYNGISINKIDCDFEGNSNVCNESNKILFFGRFYYLKGITLLIKSLELLKKKKIHFTAEIFGAGPLQLKIEKEIVRLDLTDCVKLRGFISDRKELFDEIKTATAVAMPSLLEVGPSISALEAMAFKKPVVAFDTPFSREFIKDMHNGLLAKAFDVEDFANKLAMLLIDNDLSTKLGLNAYEYVTKNHDWKILVEQYIDLYSKQISPKK